MEYSFVCAPGLHCTSFSISCTTGGGAYRNGASVHLHVVAGADLGFPGGTNLRGEAPANYWAIFCPKLHEKIGREGGVRPKFYYVYSTLCRVVEYCAIQNVTP